MAEKLNFCKGIRVWETYSPQVMQEDISCTLLARADFNNAVILGYLENGKGELTKHQSNTVYSANGISPTLDTVHGLAIVKVVVKDD